MASKKTNILRYCPMCGFEIEASNFYTSINPHHNGFSIYCKNCSQKIYLEYYSITKDVAKALWFTCSELGIPFINRIYRSMMDSRQKAIDKYTNEINVENNKKKHNVIEVKKYIDNYKVIGSYVDFLRKTNSQGDDWSTFLATDVDYKDVSSNIEALEVKESEKAQYLLDWGIQDESTDYQFLDNIFAKYTKGVEFINSQQEDLYRDLCRDRLLLRKINDGRYNGDETIDKIQNRIAKTMSILKVDQFSDTKPKTSSEESFFAKIAQIETTKPCDLYKEPKKYKDFNKLQMYERDMCLRPLLNTLCGMRDFNISVDDIEKYNLDED